MLVILHWAICLAIGGPCALVLVVNGLALVGTLWTRKPVTLVLPFLAGPLCALACWFCPSATWQAYAWLPLVADVGLWAIVASIFAAIFGGRPGDEPEA